MSVNSQAVAVVIPCFRVKKHILYVVEGIGDEVDYIVVVDDACPEKSGEFVLGNCCDARIKVVTHTHNQGVGGAVLTGYRYAAELGAEIMVKLDGDGQMDPSLIDLFVRPIKSGQADYTKGNRFYNAEDVRTMPPIRLVGNAILSFMTKISSGYWTIFDPTNGYTAISTAVFHQLPSHKIQRRYFFESDMLFRLGTIRACVLDVPMEAVYGDERSGLRISRILHQFFLRNIANLCKRIAYNYFLRDFTLASIELIVGGSFLVFGVSFGTHQWVHSISSGVTSSTGTVMLAALPVILGVQLVLSFLAFDISATPNKAIHAMLATKTRLREAVTTQLTAARSPQ